MIKDLRYPLKQRPCFRNGPWSWLCRAESDFGLDFWTSKSKSDWTWTWTSTSNPADFGLDLDLKSNSESDFGLDLDLKSNAESDFGLDLDLKSRTLVGLGLLARKPDFGKVRGRGIGLWFWTWTSCASPCLRAAEKRLKEHADWPVVRAQMDGAYLAGPVTALDEVEEGLWADLVWLDAA